MEIFFGLVLLLLAGAVVVLFAMVGELGARVGNPSAPNPSTAVAPLEDARVGHAPSSWPAGLESVASAHDSIVLVLSTVCSSCMDVAQRLAAAPDDARMRSIGVVVTCGDSDSGAEFVERYDLGGRPHYVDLHGEWVRSEFNIQSSPVALVFSHAAVEAVLKFNDVPSLVDAADEILAKHVHKEVVQ